MKKKNIGSNYQIKYEGEPITVYANHIEIRGTPWDISVIFGELIKDEENVRCAKALTRVYVSPHIAKVLSELLAKNVSRYEELFGVLSLPK